MTDEKAQWKKTGGFAKDSTVAQITCKEDDLDEWDKEAENRGYNSRSSYLYELIQEARAYRERGFLGGYGAQDRIQELETQIEHLEEKLEKEQSKDSGVTRFEDPEFVKDHLTPHYQPLEEIIRTIVESGAVNNLIRKPVENQLYKLAQRGEVEYERGHGWKLSQGGD